MNSSQTDISGRSILIVDDNPVDLHSLSQMLAGRGYQVRAVISGARALESVQAHLPDLILLDILMPKMNGYEVCERLKADEQTRDIPIIFVSALDETEDKVQAFAMGGVDYVAKPFQVEEVLARVETHLALRNLQKDLQKKNIQLEREIIERRQAEEELQASEAKYRELVQNANSIILRLDTQGRITFFNEFAQSFFGYAEDEILGRNVVGTVVPETEASGRDLVAMIKDIAQRPERYINNENENIRRNGERVWIAWTNKAILDDEGRVTEILCIGNDITERKRAEDALRKSETLFHSLIESLPQNVFSKDLEGQFTFANQRYCTTEGKSLEDILGKTDFDLHPPELAKKYREDDQRVIETEQLFETVEEHQPIGGKKFYVQVIKTPVYESEGQVTGVLGIFWDITERKRAEEEIRQRTAQLEALREVGLELTAQLDLDTLLHSIVSRAIGLLGGIAGGLDLYRPERDVLEAVTTVGDAPARVGSIIQRGEGLSGQVWDMDEPLVVDNYQRWEGRVTAYKGRPITAVMGVPVRWGKEFLGVLIVEADAPHEFSQADVELLGLFATQAAIAIRNVHLFQAEREQRELAEALEEAAAAVSGTLDLDEVLDHILEQLERVVAGNAFNVMMVEDGVARIVGWRGYKSLDVETQVASFSLPIAEYPMLAKMVETGEPIVIPDTATDPDWVLLEWGGWLRSYIGAPIRVGGVTVGFLNVDGTRPGQFGPADARRLEAFASHAATAIENARLYEQARRDAATKAALLQEVNHRVKNNLSAIIGLIHAEERHAQAKGETTDEAIMKNLVSRIQRLAMVHDLLSESEWAPLSLSELAEQVVHAALQALLSDKCVSVDILPSPVQVMPKQANSLALVINELVTNTVKYALRGHQTARIIVRITLKDDTVLFEFRDDGPGYPEDVLRLERYDVGLYLIQRLVRIDLRGVLTLRNNHGAVTTIRFKTDR